MTVAETPRERFLTEMGHVLRQARQKAGLSQEALSLDAQIAVHTVKSCEAGGHGLTLIRFLDVMYALDADRSLYERIIDLHARFRQEQAA